MNSKHFSSSGLKKYGLIETLESRIAPAGLNGVLSDPTKTTFVTASAGGAIRLSAGDVLSNGASGGGLYYLYVERGEVLVHTTDFNHNNQLDFNEITGLSVSNGARVDVFVDIHGDIVTDLNPDFSLTNSFTNPAKTQDGRILLDSNINAIIMRSPTASDFMPTANETAAQIASDHTPMSSYSIFGNIYAGGGLGVASDPTSGLHIDTSGAAVQATNFSEGAALNQLYQPTQPVIGSIYVGTAASGKSFTFGTDGGSGVVGGTLLPFTPGAGENGASIYNVSSTSAFNAGILQAGNGGFNGNGGNIVNVAMNGSTGGGYELIAGNAGPGTVGHPGGSIQNFSEAMTVTGHVLLQSGNGGSALTGSGGNAGTITFNSAAPIQVNAEFIMKFGTGGNGYTGGGNGAGLPGGNFVTPEGQYTNATDLVSTMHVIGGIGQTQSIDFDGDGYSDAVFATENPDTLQVIFGTSQGNEYGFDSTKTIFLPDAPPNISSIVVGDFGNGHPDIAVASGNASFGGVEVYMSQYDSAGHFVGFSSPVFNALPSFPGDTGLYYTPVAITKLAAGDFDGDGKMDIALVSQQFAEYVGTSVPVTDLMVLTGDGQGHFLPQFQPGQGDLELTSGATTTIIHSTALKTFTPGTDQDVLIQSAQGANSASIFNVTGNQLNSVGGIGFGQVDTNRGSSTTLVNFDVLDFAVTQDITHPNFANVVALSKTPANFLVTEQGAGDGTFTIQSGTGHDAGFFLGTGVKPVAIVAAADKSAMAYSDVGLLEYADTADTFDVVIPAGLASYTIGTDWGWLTPDPMKTSVIAFDTYNPHPVQVSSLAGSGPYEHGYVEGTNLGADIVGAQNFSVGQPNDTKFNFGLVNYFGPNFKDDGYFITAGQGGNALDGAGGSGGSIGQHLTVTKSAPGFESTTPVITATGSLSFVLPADPSFEGTMNLYAGSGGVGFKAGGGGGNVLGLSVTYAGSSFSGNVSLFAGNGGQSLTGTGGSGGVVGQMNIESALEFVGGTGGAGVVGGSGGSVQGTIVSGLTTTVANSQSGSMFALAGSGGTGIFQGGGGGSVDTLNAQFPPATFSGAQLEYVGGTGGDSVAGHAGAGGNVVNSSPVNTSLNAPGGANFFSGDITLLGGGGGNGLNAGDGGSIKNFTDSPSIADLPGLLTVIGGAGGSATVGTGGHGGAIQGFSAPSKGQSVYSLQTYNRLIGGAGGSSVGGKGGDGGTLSGINSTAAASDAQSFIAAGAGGDGLTAGGLGGSVLSSTVNAGATTGKVVIVAGDGGNSSSAAPVDLKDPTDVALSIGGVNGPGGNGGSIQNFTQPGSIGTHVDLIAGNGGATFGHSVAEGNVTTDNSGSGGSITGVNISGDIGNLDPTVAIKSYNDFAIGQTMQQFIDSFVLGTNNSLTDAVGNVGLVAGAAGRVEGGGPSANGTNGSVSNISARDIMSMVAGSVDQVDFIQSLTNYGSYLSSGANFGSDKSVSAFGYTASVGTYDYATAQGNVVNGSHPPAAAELAGGVLIDGYFLAKNIRSPLKGPFDIEGTQL